MSSRRAEKHDARQSGPMRSNEPPSRIMPPPRIKRGMKDPWGGTADQWDNGYYYGWLRRYDAGCPIGGGPYAMISLTACDETARHDWRELQQLKNHLVGPEWEALELYPAESRLIDPSNRFYLWCMPLGVITWGSAAGSRSVINPRDAHAPQRAFPCPEE